MLYQIDDGCLLFQKVPLLFEALAIQQARSGWVVVVEQRMNGAAEIGFCR